jgi:hypothetical protein
MKATIESQQVQRYTLKNPDQYFEKLLEDWKYNKDIKSRLDG